MSEKARKFKAYLNLRNFGIFTLAFILFILLGMFLFRTSVFDKAPALSIVEWIIGFGFVLIFFFNLISLARLVRKISKTGKAQITEKILMILGALCLVFLAGEKTMADEIAREQAMGWETLGEWIILYGFLMAQLVYVALFVRYLGKRG